jgi:hypothetical protein
MIKSQDRSGWFGASDTARIMGNWNTKTFDTWWLEKLELHKSTFKTKAMQTGTAYEHRILEFLGIKKMDRQIKIRRLRLRVNLDGEDEAIHEVKTYGGEFKVSQAYWQQAQVEMFATRKPLVIDAYKLLPEDYENYFNPIDKDRISEHPIEYDPMWIQSEYLPRLRYLAKCLRRRAFPNEHDYKIQQGKNTLGRRLLALFEALRYD